MFNLLLELIDHIKNEVDTASVEIRNFCQNEDNDLEERWKLACAFPEAFPKCPAHYYLEDLGDKEICLYSDLYIERYQTVEVLDKYFVERLVDCENFNFTEAQVKEYILSKGYSKFTNDW